MIRFMDGVTPAVGAMESFCRRVSVAAFGALIALTDLLPPRLRYGYVHPLTRALFSRPVAYLPGGASCLPHDTVEVPSKTATDLTCVLATDHLDIGGIGSVIEMLAGGLAALGIKPVVLCQGDGVKAGRLRGRGVTVIPFRDARSAAAALTQVPADVIQVHSAPPYMERIAMESALPLITVMHNTEIHFTRARWKRFRELMEKSVYGISVSETVRAFHARHVPTELAERMTVVPNDAPSRPPGSRLDRKRARQELESVIRSSLTGAIIFGSLVRYDSQKNIVGTVASFLDAISDVDSPAHLVVAGDVSDWPEYLRAKGVTRGNIMGNRVHLLGNSSAATLLEASDAFLLNSFFEGWPVAATEASVAGLPLLISDVGGARELVARDPDRSILIPNPCGEAGAVSDAKVRSARRRALHQRNQAEFAAAVRSIVKTVRLSVGSEEDGLRTSAARVVGMAEGHAKLIRAAVGARHGQHHARDERG